MSITDRLEHEGPQEKLLANRRAALPEAKLLTIVLRILAAQLQAVM